MRRGKRSTPALSERQLLIGLFAGCAIVALWLVAFDQGYRFGKDWARAEFISSSAGARD